MTGQPVPWRTVADGLELTLKVTPNAGRDNLEGTELRDDGSAVLRVRVAAVPDKGKANKSVIALVAARFGLAKSLVTLVSGETARLKRVHIEGAPEDLSIKAAKLFQSDA